MTDISIDSATFRVDVQGEPGRPALLLCHPLGANLDIWDPLIPAFLPHFQVVRYDSRGHGGSSVLPGPYGIGDLGRDAIAILDALRIETAHVIGVSMGGAVGLWCLIHAPHRVERAIIACSAAHIGAPDGWNARILSALRDGVERTAATAIDRWFSPAFVAREPDRVAAIRAMIAATSPQGYAACCAALRDMDMRHALHDVGTPTLVVTGTQDEAVSAGDTANLLAVLGNARHIAIDARHMAPIEAEAVFAEAVVEFLTAKLPVRRRPNKPANRAKASRRASAARQPIVKPVAPRPKPAARAAKPKTSVSKARSPVKTPAKAANKTSAKPKARKGSEVAGAETKAPGRRPPKTSAARGAIKKAATKAKPGKAPAKKAAAKKSAAKRPPAARRKPAKTPRRPRGRPKT